MLPTSLYQEYQSATENVALWNLGNPDMIEVSGRDARIFLHNLCTQDVKNLPVGAGCEAFLTTNKARVIAHFWIGHYETASVSVLCLDMVPGQREKVLQHLDHYLISEQVELRDCTQDFTLIRLVGPNSETLLADVLTVSLADLKPLAPRRVPEIGYVRRQQLLGLDGFDVFCTPAALLQLQQSLAGRGVLMGSPETYEILRIEAGLPQYGSDIDESRLAMETGRTAQAISYAKGCYLGQETIVMARDRGQVNRLLTGIKVAEGSPLTSAQKLFRSGSEVGEVTSSVHSPRLGQVIALAYVRRGNWEHGTELVVEPGTDGRKAVVCGLPF